MRHTYVVLIVLAILLSLTWCEIVTLLRDTMDGILEFWGRGGFPWLEFWRHEGESQFGIPNALRGGGGGFQL